MNRTSPDGSRSHCARGTWRVAICPKCRGLGDGIPARGVHARGVTREPGPRTGRDREHRAHTRRTPSPAAGRRTVCVRSRSAPSSAWPGSPCSWGSGRRRARRRRGGVPRVAPRQPDDGRPPVDGLPRRLRPLPRRLPGPALARPVRRTAGVHARGERRLHLVPRHARPAGRAGSAPTSTGGRATPPRRRWSGRAPLRARVRPATPASASTATIRTARRTRPASCRRCSGSAGRPSASGAMTARWRPTSRPPSRGRTATPSSRPATAPAPRRPPPRAPGSPGRRRSRPAAAVTIRTPPRRIGTAPRSRPPPPRSPALGASGSRTVRRARLPRSPRSPRATLSAVREHEVCLRCHAGTRPGEVRVDGGHRRGAQPEQRLVPPRGGPGSERHHRPEDLHAGVERGLVRALLGLSRARRRRRARAPTAPPTRTS